MSIPRGTFLMGSPEEALTWHSYQGAAGDELPQREVTIPAFQMCQTEVTQAHYAVVMGTNPSDCDYGCGNDYPVQKVSWNDAVAYLNSLTALESEAWVAEGKPPLSACYEGSGTRVRWVQGCTGYRLPTEAEWEYAARAGTTTSWSFGWNYAVTGDYAWYAYNAKEKAHKVSTKKANPWGLYDVHGNVWEWVWDAFDTYQHGKLVNSEGDRRVLRGGLFDLPPDYVRSAMRGFDVYVDGSIGFRCARGSGPKR